MTPKHRNIFTMKFNLNAISGYHKQSSPHILGFMTSNAILNLMEVPDMSRASEVRQWEAVMSRDPNQDGRFVFAVSSTGVYCRPSCPSRRPRRENVIFFRKPDEAEKAGYRACF